MSSSAERGVKIALAYCGPIFVLLYIVFWALMGHNIPPPRFVGLSGEEFVAAYYAQHSSIQIGMLVTAAAGMLYLPWSILLASLLRDSNGQMGPLSLLELTGGTLTAWVLVMCPAIWAACASLAGRVDPDIVLALHNTSWTIYDCTYMITTMQLAGVGLYTVLNRTQTIFPAWAGWAALATGAVFVPLTIMPLIPEGPFAVNGTWNFFTVFSIWLFAFFSVYSFYMIKHVHGGERASHGAGQSVGVAAE